MQEKNSLEMKARHEKVADFMFNNRIRGVHFEIISCQLDVIYHTPQSLVWLLVIAFYANWLFTSYSMKATKCFFQGHIPLPL